MSQNQVLSQKLVPPSTFSEDVATGVSVYAMIDVSPSMRGSKIGEVCTSIKDIIESCPPYVLFDIGIFNHSSRKLITALKSAINVDKIINEIQAACAETGGTALYDSWFDMITSIPESVLKNDEVQIFVLTDGEDNSSKRSNLKDVTEKTDRVINGSSKTKFNFVQVGQSVNADIVEKLSTIKKGCGDDTVQTLVVEDSAKGIKDALQSVRADIMLSSSRGGHRKIIPPTTTNNSDPVSIDTTTAYSNLQTNPMLTTNKKKKPT